MTNINELKQEVTEALMEMAQDRKMDPGNMIKVLGLDSQEPADRAENQDYIIRVREE